MWRHDDYECKKCPRVFEEMTKDNSVVRCPACNGKTARLISAPRIDWRHMGIDPGFPGAYSKWAKAKLQHHTKDKGQLHGGKGHNLSQY